MEFVKNKRYKFIILIILLIMLSVGLKVLYKEWRLANIYSKNPVSNLLSLVSWNAIEKIQGINIFDPGTGLNIISFSIPEKSINVLTSDLPNNLKKWQPAFMRYPDGNMYPIKIRTRGDNPINWATIKNHLGLKLRKIIL